jgi:hypothetical protein
MGNKGPRDISRSKPIQQAHLRGPLREAGRSGRPHRLLGTAKAQRCHPAATIQCDIGRDKISQGQVLGGIRRDHGSPRKNPSGSRGTCGFFCFVLFCFCVWWCWGLNSGPPICSRHSTSPQEVLLNSCHSTVFGRLRGTCSDLAPPP